MLGPSKGLVLGLLAFLQSPFVVSAATLGGFTSVSLPLRTIFDNQAASTNGTANFDGHGGSFNSQFLPSGPWTHDGIQVSIYTPESCLPKIEFDVDNYRSMISLQLGEMGTTMLSRMVKL